MAQGQAHKYSETGWLLVPRVRPKMPGPARVGVSPEASPDEVTISHAIGRGLFVKICHLLLVQFVHIHLHVCTKRKAVRGRSRARGGGIGAVPQEAGTGAAHRMGGLRREGTSQLISASPAWHRAWPGVDIINGGGGGGQVT